MERVVNMLATKMDGTYRIKLGVAYLGDGKQVYFPDTSNNRASGAAVERIVKIEGINVTVEFPTMIPFFKSKYTGKIAHGVDIKYITSHEWILINDNDGSSGFGTASHVLNYQCGEYYIDLKHDL